MADITKRDYLKLTGVSFGAVALASGGLVVSNAGKALGTPTAAPAPAPAVSPTAGSVTPPGTGGTEPTDDAVAADLGAEQPQTGGPRSGDRLDYERDDDGNVEFTWEGVDFETRDGNRDVEMTVDRRDVALDLETRNGCRDVELTLSVGGEYVDFEVDDDDVEFEAIGGPIDFEDDDREIEYRGEAIQLEWDDDDPELDVTGDVTLEVSRDELEYRDGDVRIEWERGGEFEARLL
jgi:hypothetical protein